MATVSEKKRAKLANLLTTYRENERTRTQHFLTESGFPSTLGSYAGHGGKGKKRKKKEVDPKDKGAFVDEMFSVLIEYFYDSYLTDPEIERTHQSIPHRLTLHDLLTLGPDGYIVMKRNNPAEGKNECARKVGDKSRYLPSKMDIKRFSRLGGAVEMSQESKDLLSVIVRMNESSQIQKASSLANSNYGRRTLLQRDLVLGHTIEGFDTVSV
jgi:hypothetical protein